MWTFNDIRVYLQGKRNDLEQIIARLNPQSGPTVLHKFGNDSEKVDIEMFIFGTGNMASMKSLISPMTSYVFSGPEGQLGSWFLHSLRYDREMTANTVMFDQPNTPTDAPLYNVTMELYLDES